MKQQIEFTFKQQCFIMYSFFVFVIWVCFLVLSMPNINSLVSVSCELQGNNLFSFSQINGSFVDSNKQLNIDNISVSKVKCDFDIPFFMLKDVIYQ